MKESKASEAKKPFPKILKNKWYLYMTEFFSGMSVMAVELGASRLLAPYFSSSQIVWTIIIGTIMIAMALGNIFGGRSADKHPDPDKLYGRILIAAVWIAAVPFAGKFAIAGIAGLLVVTINTNFLIWAAFITCMTVFVYPLFLLGTVTPSLVKYTVDSLDDSGKTVGTAVTFIIFAGILLLIGVIYFISSRRGAVRTAVSCVLFGVFCVSSVSMGFAFWEKDLTYEGESVYNYLQVKDDEKHTYLSTNVLFGVQSVYVKSGELSGMYYDYAMAAPLMTASPDTADVLVLGMGTGTYAKQCTAYFSDITAEGVEIDEKITALAHEYFDLPEDIKVTTYDGRAFLASCGKKYDVIMVDAYQDITIPFQMSSREFFRLVRDHLSDDGVMVVNMNMRSDSAGGINGCLADTIASVFDNVYTVDVERNTNRELFASQNGDMIRMLEENTKTLEDDSLKSLMEKVSSQLTPHVSGGNILTDDKAPVELLGMQVIDDIIQDELVYYKEVFREKGIKGLLEG